MSQGSRNKNCNVEHDMHNKIIEDYISRYRERKKKKKRKFAKVR